MEVSMRWMALRRILLAALAVSAQGLRPPVSPEGLQTVAASQSTPPASRELKTLSGISVPVLLDSRLAVARQDDLLPEPGQPMGERTGVAQMGFVIVHGRGIIRVQRADVYFGRHAGQIADILRRLAMQGRRGVPPWSQPRRTDQRVHVAEMGHDA